MKKSMGYIKVKSKHFMRNVGKVSVIFKKGM